MRPAVLLAIACASWLAGSSQAQPQLHWITATPNEPELAIVEISGLTAAEVDKCRAHHAAAGSLSRLLSVRALPAGDAATPDDLPSMLGQVVWRQDGFRFSPRFPLQPGAVYRAELRLAPFQSDGGSRALLAAHQVPAAAQQPSTHVTAVHPSTAQLPANLLKFYLHFSAPMSRGCAPRHVRLLDAKGDAVELPFLELAEELWSPDQTRLTLLLDPGRIKRGLLPQEETGPALAEGQSYTLEIGSDWPDADNQPLIETRRHTFHVVTADTLPPNPSRWKLEPPAASTRAALIVHFDEPMDHALTQRLIAVETESAQSVRGVVTLNERDQHWSFVPEKPWSAEAHRLVINTLLEDLAGNQIGRVFDVDTFEEVLPPSNTHAMLTFTPR